MGNAVPDIPRIYTALAEWSACLIFILILRPRFSKRIVAVISVLAVIIMTSFMLLTATPPLWLWLPWMGVAFAMMIGFIYSCAKVSLCEAVYYAVLAFGVAECAASVEWQMANDFFDNVYDMSRWLQAVMIVVVYGVIEIGFWKLARVHIPADGCLEIGTKDLTLATFIGAIVFGVSNLGFVTMDVPMGEFSGEISKTRALVDIAGVTMLYAHLLLCCETKVRRELEAVQNVLQNQYHQYKLSRESVDLVNYKYHDMKHQIAVLRSETDPQKRDAFLDRMEEEIKQYELQNKTGNHVLDTVLTSKSFYCNKHGITLTSVVDGKLLEFMETMDICSIFGNALDNAIESVLKIAEKERRLIHVTVSKQKNFLLIRVENYYESGITLQEGLPVSTKTDKQYHGYGIKSIRYTVSKYDGAVYIDTENQWFDLKILIPLKD